MSNNTNNNIEEVSNNLFGLLMHIHNKLFNANQMVKGLHIPPSHAKVIYYLSRKESSSVSEIAEHLCISKPNMTPIIDKLIVEDFVCRYTDPDDRRKIKVKLTDKAYDFIKEREKNIKANLYNKISSLDVDDLENLNLSIKDMNEIISKLK